MPRIVKEETHRQACTDTLVKLFALKYKTTKERLKILKLPGEGGKS